MLRCNLRFVHCQSFRCASPLSSSFRLEAFSLFFNPLFFFDNVKKSYPLKRSLVESRVLYLDAFAVREEVFYSVIFLSSLSTLTSLNMQVNHLASEPFKLFDSYLSFCLTFVLLVLVCPHGMSPMMCRSSLLLYLFETALVIK